MQLSHRGETRARAVERPVEGRRLVRVLAVAEGQRALGVEPQPRRELVGRRRRRARRSRRAEIGGDRRVVLCRPPERLLREPVARGLAEPALLSPELVEHERVLGRVGHDADARVVLGRGADQRRAAYVDLLDRLGERHTRLRHRRLERIERDDDQVDRRDTVPVERLQMRGHVPSSEDPAVDLRVERLHPAVEHLGEPGDVAHLTDGDARLAQEPGRPPGREDLDAEPRERPGEVDDAGLVVDRDERAPDPHRTSTFRPASVSRPSAKRRTASG